MTTQQRPAPDRTTTPGPGGLAWLGARSELVVVAGVLALAIFLTVETVRMDVPEGIGSPGPRFFPTIIAGFLYLQALLLVIDVLRHPSTTHGQLGTSEISHEMLEDLASLEDTVEREPIDPDIAPTAPSIDWKTVGIVFGGLVGFVVLLEAIGWLLCATGLFWLVSRALGSKRPVFDLAIAALVAAIVQLAFSAGLGLNLPAGVFEGVLPWNN